MVVDNKATVTYVQLLKEDLVIIRLVPKEGPVPEYKAGQFITLGLPNPRRIQNPSGNHVCFLCVVGFP